MSDSDEEMEMPVVKTRVPGRAPPKPPSSTEGPPIPRRQTDAPPDVTKPVSIPKSYDRHTVQRIPTPTKRKPSGASRNQPPMPSSIPTRTIDDAEVRKDKILYFM